MRTELAIGLGAVSQRGNERGGDKAAKEDARAFDAALAGKAADMTAPKTAARAAKAPPQDADAAPREDRRPWRLTAYADTLAPRMPREAEVEDGLVLAAPAQALPEEAGPEETGPDRDTDAPAIDDAPPATIAIGLPPTTARRDDDMRSADTGDAEPTPTGDETELHTLLQAASSSRERQTAGDGERPPALPQERSTPQPPAQAQTQPQPAAAPRESRAVPQAPANPGEAGREPVRAAGGTAAPPSTETGATPSPRVATDTGPQSEPGPGPKSELTPKPEPGQARVSVLGFSTSSAPVMPPAIAMASLAPQLTTTAAGVVAAIEAEPTWRAAAADALPGQRAQAHGTVSSLRIQLNPAELGMVTARLVASGSQLEIEIRVESNDARQRLANDADVIVKALRGVGYDVERVTIQQAPQGGSPAQQQGDAAGRDALTQQDQQQDRAGAGAGGRNGREGADNAGAARRNAGETAAQHSGGGVYI